MQKNLRASGLKSFKAKKCKNCDELFTPERTFQQVCNFKCARELSMKKQAKEKSKLWKVEKKVKKEKIKTLSDWKKDLQKEINTIVRLIDNGQPCIATGATTGKRNAGHYYSVGSNDTLRFNLHNIHIQSEASNTYKSGDTIKYQNGLRLIYGNDYFRKVQRLQMIKPLKLTIPEIKEAIKTAKKIAKYLKLIEHNVYNPTERMVLRENYNRLIGIYKQIK